MLAITIALGIWQIERRQWKLGLLEAIDRAEAAPPAALTASPAPFQIVTVTGRFRDDLSAYYGSEVRSTLAGPQLGAQLVMPLERADGVAVLVDRGWTPEHAPVPADGPSSTVTGYVRPAEAGGLLTPTSDPARHRFWALDPAPIGAALGIPVLTSFTIVALGPGEGVPEPAHALPRPPNDHLSYAITWFGLAGCLVLVFATYVRRTLRR